MKHSKHSMKPLKHSKCYIETDRAFDEDLETDKKAFKAALQIDQVYKEAPDTHRVFKAALETDLPFKEDLDTKISIQRSPPPYQIVHSVRPTSPKYTQ